MFNTRLDTSRTDSPINSAPIPYKIVVGVGIGTVTEIHDCRAATKHTIDPITEFGCKLKVVFFRAGRSFRVDG